MTRLFTKTEMLGLDPNGDPERELRAKLDAMMSDPRFRGFGERLRRGDDSTDLRTSDEPVVARVNGGRWVGDCQCGGGIALDPAHSFALCFDCGTWHTNIDAPDPKEIHEAEKILALRPEGPTTDPFLHLNWNRKLGETVEDLKVDNITRGEAIV